MGASAACFGECERDGAGGVAGEVNHVEGDLADGDCVAVLEEAVGPDGQCVGVEWMGGGVHAGGRRDVLERQPVVAVLVRGDDQVERRRVFADKLVDAVRLVGGVDEDGFSGCGTDDQVHVVVHGADGHLRDRGSRNRAALRRRTGGDVAGVRVFYHHGLLGHDGEATVEYRQVSGRAAIRPPERVGAPAYHGTARGLSVHVRPRLSNNEGTWSGGSPYRAGCP